MSRRSPSIFDAEYTTYDFTASSEIDYNYDPSGNTRSTFDPYTDSLAPAWHSRRNAHLDQYRRTPSPSIPTSPSAEYIAESQKASVRLTVPTEAHLNGTLVYRSSHRREYRPFRRYAHQSDSHPWPASSTDPGDPYADTTAPRPLRVVHPRPYMRTFREYLFHPSTRAWLDTMVWSSAQPHSVADMVEKCFGSQQNELLAVWARDTLGLEERDYHRKTQTTKDLSKPWSKLPITSSGRDTPQAHSAHTTLLMDDSPRKVYLQPYNHLCIREYTGALRQIDLQYRQYEKRAQQINFQQSQADTSESTLPPEAAETFQTSPSLSQYLSRHTSQITAEKQNKRPKNKHPEYEPAEPKDELNLGLGGYDPTLLAVVGVLERIKWEGNVAGWVRNGGLATSYKLEEDGHLEEGEGGGLTQQKAGEREQKESGENDESLGAGASMSLSAPQGEIKRRRVWDEQHSLPVTDGDPVSFPSSLNTSSTLGAAAPEMIGNTGQWFEDKAALRYWVRKGMKALDGLGIEIVSGVVG
ncbi:hypothetical protein C0995_001339 [Termitomyces sp. Mi166|nr:hypothetical protein C0995_001339 [Termitomyces sp. Mi166\